MDVKSIISQMTLEEKAALCSGKDFWHLDTPQRLGIESVMVSDGPCGIRKQSDAADHLGLNASVPATSYPTGSCMACSFDRELFRRSGEVLGHACHGGGPFSFCSARPSTSSVLRSVAAILSIFPKTRTSPASLPKTT